MKVAFGILTVLMMFGCEEKKPQAAEAAKPTSNPWPTSTTTPTWGTGGTTTGNDPWGFNDDEPEDDFGFGGNSDDDCRKSDCPRGKVEVSVDGRRDLTGRVGEPVRWDFEAEPDEYRNHRLVIYKIEASPMPSQMNIRGNETDNARLDWIPGQNDPATGRVSVSVRDMTACETVEKDEEDCEDFDRRQRDYDTEETFSWRIEGATGVGTNSGGNDMGNQIMLVMGLGALQGALNGQGIFTGALNGLSALGGGIGGLNQGTQINPLGTTNWNNQPTGNPLPTNQPGYP